MDLINKGLSQKDAHLKTCELYDYPKQADMFYGRLQNEPNARIGKDDIISGAISHNTKKDWGMYL